ncbi:MAG TPA: hypothetical protein GXX19_10670 [Syntrophomonadaceae bacterium]|nr:hypothetical protein [Syntrophomonadaceae bacterium]
MLKSPPETLNRWVPVYYSGKNRVPHCRWVPASTTIGEPTARTSIAANSTLVTGASGEHTLSHTPDHTPYGHEFDVTLRLVALHIGKGICLQYKLPGKNGIEGIGAARLLAQPLPAVIVFRPLWRELAHNKKAG